jgi:hypothetical protein
MLLEPLVNEIKKVAPVVRMNISIYENVVWCYTDNELSINTDGCEDSLFDGEGDTYTWEVSYATESDDGYVLFCDADACTGYTETIIVKASERRE